MVSHFHNTLALHYLGFLHVAECINSTNFNLHLWFLQEILLSKEQLLQELDMYQEIAVAKGSEYDRLNQKMDRCQENIETLSDEIQRLQACLADEELQAEEDSIEDLRRRAEEERFRAQLEAQQREEDRRREEERR